MTVAIKKSTGTLYELALLNFEMKLKSKLPDDYRSFLLEYNGGKPEENMFAIPKAKKQCGVTCFFGIYNSKKATDLVTERARFSDRLPVHILPIAGAKDGNLVCLSVASSDFGSVYLWNHELETESSSGESFLKIVPSFSEFMAALQKYDPTAVKKKEGLVTALLNGLKNLFSG